MSNINNYMYLL